MDEVLTLLHSNQTMPHGSTGLPAGEHGRRRPALQPVPLMRSLPVVEPQVVLQVALQLPDVRVVGPAERDAPQFAQDCALQPFDEPVRPRMARFGGPMLDAQVATRGQEAPIELWPVAGQDGTDRMARAAIG